MRWDPSSDQFAKKEETLCFQCVCCWKVVGNWSCVECSEVGFRGKVSAFDACLPWSRGWPSGWPSGDCSQCCSWWYCWRWLVWTRGQWCLPDGHWKPNTINPLNKRESINPNAGGSVQAMGGCLDTAKRMLQVTTQSGIQNVLAPVENKRSLQLGNWKFVSGGLCDDLRHQKGFGVIARRAPDKDVLGSTPDNFSMPNLIGMSHFCIGTRLAAFRMSRSCLVDELESP